MRFCSNTYGFARVSRLEREVNGLFELSYIIIYQKLTISERHKLEPNELQARKKLTNL